MKTIMTLILKRRRLSRAHLLAFGILSFSLVLVSAINLVFPVMQKAIENHGSFWGFTFMAVVNLFFVLFLVPETKGHSLEDIEKIFIKKQVKESI